jgi:hypothetical protein
VCTITQPRAQLAVARAVAQRSAELRGSSAFARHCAHVYISWLHSGERNHAITRTADSSRVRTAVVTAARSWHNRAATCTLVSWGARLRNDEHDRAIARTVTMQSAHSCDSGRNCAARRTIVRSLAQSRSNEHGRAAVAHSRSNVHSGAMASTLAQRRTQSCARSNGRTLVSTIVWQWHICTTMCTMIR